MDAMGVSVCVFIGISLTFKAVLAQEHCSGDLWCEQGHCCGSDGTHCCTYYYELWWFWMIWGLIVMLSCCCLYQQHRLKKRQRLALRALQTRFNHPSLTVFPTVNSGDSSGTGNQDSQFRLPTYDEVRDLSKDPPPYEVLFEGGPPGVQPVESPRPASQPESTFPSASVSVPLDSIPHIDHRDDAGLLANEAVPEDDPPPTYSVSMNPPAAAHSHPLEAGNQ